MTTNEKEARVCNVNAMYACAVCDYTTKSKNEMNIHIRYIGAELCELNKVEVFKSIEQF